MFAWLNKHKGKFLVLGAAVAGYECINIYNSISKMFVVMCR